jgi:polyferredoxin
VLLSDGSVRNGYTVKILNKLHQPRHFTLGTRGLEGASMTIVGVEAGAKIRVTTDDLRELKVFVALPPARLAASTAAPISFELVVRDVASGDATARSTLFQRPNPGRGQ